MPTLSELFQLSLSAGIEADPRGKEGVARALARKQKAFDSLPYAEKARFDQESLTNPYSDSRILVGDPSLPIAKVMAGIDIDASEVLLADRLNEKGAGIDLILGHHPIGSGLAALHDVMDMQVELMAHYGIPVNVGEGMLRERIAQVERKINPENHTQVTDAARMLDIPLMCTHTITDNLVYRFFADLLANRSFDTVSDVLEMLWEIPEYQEAQRTGAGPRIFVGDPINRAGKVAPLEITGGTGASENVYEKYAQAGIGTIISMHASEAHVKEAQKHHINLVVAGHMSSDSIGMNLLLDRFEAQGVEVITCSGLIRVKRNAQ